MIVLCNKVLLSLYWLSCFSCLSVYGAFSANSYTQQGHPPSPSMQLDSNQTSLATFHLQEHEKLHKEGCKESLLFHSALLQDIKQNKATLKTLEVKMDRLVEAKKNKTQNSIWQNLVDGSYRLMQKFYELTGYLETGYLEEEEKEEATRDEKREEVKAIFKNNELALLQQRMKQTKNHMDAYSAHFFAVSEIQRKEKEAMDGLLKKKACAKKEIDQLYKKEQERQRHVLKELNRKKKIQIFVRLPHEKLKVIRIASGDRIQKIKEILYEETGIPVPMQSLSWKGDPLMSKWLLRAYGIHENATLQLTQRMSLGNK